MEIRSLRRYPVKSMLGEPVARLAVDAGGAAGDRRLAVLDVETGRVATAKHPRLWRALLRCSASGDPGQVRITVPGATAAAEERAADELLSALLGRPVRLTAQRPAGALLERPDPEDVLEHGVDADVPYQTLEVAQGTPGDSFVDYAPLHVITTATLEHIGAEAERYRPNIVLATPPGHPPWSENGWVGRELSVGGVRLRAVLPTPRCSVPTLEHGSLPRAPHAVRTPMAQNRVDVPGFGRLPCAGVYLEVLDPGVLSVGYEVTVH